jgi:hypothetical protein
MKTYGGTELNLHHFWPQYQFNVSSQFHPPAALLPVKILRDGHMLWGWVNHRIRPDAVKTLFPLPGIELSS